jgi:hypothetical protein
MEMNGKLGAPTTLPPGQDPCTHETGCWMGPKAGLNMVIKKNIPALGLAVVYNTVVDYYIS